MCIHLYVYVYTYTFVYIEYKKCNFTAKLDKSGNVHMLKKVRKKFPYRTLLKNMYINGVI